jgi:DNA mismatch repair protein MutS
LFYEDAETAARVLGLTLTSRDKGSPNPIPMAGFPWHQLDSYLQKLIKSGFRAAICEQVEEPKLAKGLVKREVTRVVTPGTLTDDELLDPRENNFLASLFVVKGRIGLAWLELSAGRFITTDLDPADAADEIARLHPAECLIADSQRRDPMVTTLRQMNGTLVSERPAWCFARDESRRLLLEHFGTSTLDGFDLDADSPGITAAGALLDYVQETQKSALGHVTRLEPYRRGSSLIIDEATRRSLELTQTLRDGHREGRDSRTAATDV